MNEKILDLGNGFYNIRGNFRVGGVLNIGTHCSLIQLAENRFVFLDSYSLTGKLREQVMAMTDNGKQVEAVLNVHPFHTLHCNQMATDFPTAIMYGSSRHRQQCPSIDWAADNVESTAVMQRYPELQFSLPDGVHYICPNDKIHVGSLLVYHPSSRVLHVDDTFSTLPHFDTLENLANKIDQHLPEKISQKLPLVSPQKLPKVLLNPLTKFALTDAANAGKAFCDWAETLAHDWRETRYLCAAHADTVAFANEEFEPALLAEVVKMRNKLEN